MSIALNKPYCTLSQVQYFTGEDDGDYDDVLREAINFASRWIDQWCKRDFWFHDHSSDWLEITQEDEAIGRKLFLPFPVKTLTDVNLIWGDETGTNAIIDADDITYRFHNDAISGQGYIAFNVKTPDLSWPDNEIKLKGTFGYTVTDTETPPTDIPEGVTRAAVEVAGVWSGQKRKEVVALDGAKLSLLDERVPREVKELLKPFRRLVL